MRNAYVLLLLLGTLTVVGAAGSPPATETQDEQELRQIEAAIAKGEQQNDVSMMRLFASDFVSSGKKVMSKQQLEEAVRSNFVSHGNGPSPVTIEKKNMAVYLFGDTAVVTYIMEYRQTRDTTKFVDEDDTDVFKRGTKGWLLQFGKSSTVANTAVS
jgi:ketosteroid isomerase-like protein